MDYHIKAFHLPYLKWFQEQGWEVHVAASGNLELPYVDVKYDIGIARSPFKKQNITAIKKLKDTIKLNNYQIIHCHTPMGGLVTRLAAKKAREYGTKVIYTAHGFHFYKNAPLINWMLFYPIEKWLSRYTDCLITINTEDYNAANSLGFKMKTVKHVNGVGVDSERFRPHCTEEIEKIRMKNKYSNNQFLMIYAAELNKNKNQEFLIRSISKLKNTIPNVRLLLVGKGLLSDYYKDISKSEGLEEYIDFLDYREDLHELYPMCDVAVSSSLREGLPVNIIEAMSCGLPIVASKNRGHNELVEHNKNGFLFNLNTPDEFYKFISTLYEEKNKREVVKFESLERSQLFSLNRVMSQMISIYNSYL